MALQYMRTADVRSAHLFADDIDTLDPLGDVEHDNVENRYGEVTADTLALAAAEDMAHTAPFPLAIASQEDAVTWQREDGSRVVAVPVLALLGTMAPDGTTFQGDQAIVWGVAVDSPAGVTPENVTPEEIDQHKGSQPFGG